ncbi:MAG TPA: succinate--CoA ligase subunit alpha [Burkholderiales bacterium]|nr:succinate--CoA ligase subunit alpha [Burkholderiales bacterium]
MLNPRIDRQTPVIIQGITGRAGRLHSRLMREYGTNVVAGVSPKSDKRDVDGVPVYPDCRSAVEATGATTCVAFVGAYDLLAAMRDALEAGVRYIVTPTEGMPVHDALQAKRLVNEHRAIWVGPSTPGMAIAGEAKLGFLPSDALVPGPVGLMSKSGTLSYESGYRLAQRGVGTSAWIGVGGDSVKGLRYADLVPFFAQDERTRAVLLIGEIGGHEEEDFAAALTAQRFAKPVFALIAGRTAPSGVSMGHAGALVHGSFGTFEAKKAALESAGASVFDTLDAMVEGVYQRLKQTRV